MIGIPPTILGVLFVSIYLSLFSAAIFFLALALFVGGFVLQFAGHFLEGTDPGEVIYLKRNLGMPYVEFPPTGTSRRAEGSSGLHTSCTPPRHDVGFY